jgi:NADPH-dependent curcumin reductase CurA
MAVQLGKALGLYVVGVAGPANVEWVKQQLGADEVVDYKKEVGGGARRGGEVLNPKGVLCSMRAGLNLS